MRIMVIDDDQATRNVLDFTLTLEGHQVQQASNGVEGLALSWLWQPDLIIIDQMMPVMDGLSATRSLRSEERFAATPIIMLTALVRDKDQWAGWSAGVDSYVTKPLDMDMLRGEIERVCAVEQPMPA